MNELFSCAFYNVDLKWYFAAMKRSLRQYLAFSRTERMGMLALCCMIVVLVSVRAAMHFSVSPAVKTDLEHRLVATSLKLNNYDEIELPEHQDKNGGYIIPLPNIIDINTADSETLVQLVGIGPIAAHNILQRRASRPFETIDELPEVGGFTEQTLNLLKRHLKFISPSIK